MHQGSTLGLQRPTVVSYTIHVCGRVTGMCGPRFSWSGLLVSALLVSSFASVTGCASSRVAREQLAPVFPEEYRIPAGIDAVWAAVREEPGRVPGAKLLTESDEDRLLSWIEKIRPAQAKDAPMRQAEAEEVGVSGVAITTVRVTPVPGGSSLRISRIYYGPGTMPELAFSRGQIAQEMRDRVCSKLDISSTSTP